MPEAINPWLHLLAATVWVGPQVFLFVAAVPAIRTVEDAQVRARIMRVLTTRFGWLAWGAMLVLVITGIGNLFEIAPVDPEDINDINYGWILSVKIVLVVATIALTAFHSFVIGPRLLDLQESVADEAQVASARRFSIIVSAGNLLLALGILFFAALLDTTFALE
jgi:uncharacterized membrane protein